MNKKELIKDLEALQTNLMSCSDFRRKYYHQVDNNYLSNMPFLYSNFVHFLDDEDVREKDRWTQVMQKFELAKLIKLLKEDAQIEVLQNISFLDYSD